MFFFGDSDDGGGGQVLPVESFLIALESGNDDILLTEDGDNLEQEIAP